MTVQELFIKIEPLSGNRWRVCVNPIGAHERHADVMPVVKPMHADFACWSDVLAGMTPSSGYVFSLQDLRSLGEGIWTGLFGNSTLAGFLRQHVHAAHANGRSLRYVLKLDEANDPELAVLPVELAYSTDPDAGARFEWRRADVPAIRVISEVDAPPLRFESGARLVIATAHHPKRPVPDVEELAMHAGAVKLAAERRGFDVMIVPEATPDALEAALQDGADLLYIVAHGDADPDQFGVLALVDEALPGTRLKQLLEDTRSTNRPCRAVILCACSSAENRPGVRAETTGMAQELSKFAVEAALGFRAPVEVRWALAFMTRLFDALARDADLEIAFTRARGKTPEADPQWSLPAYYGRPLKLVEASPSAVIHSDHRPIGPAPASVLPAKPRDYFTAREAEIERILHLTAMPGIAVIHAIEGEGGIGKSELARVVAHRLAAKRPVLWLDRADQHPRAAWDKLLAALPGNEHAATSEMSDAAFANHVRERFAGHGGLLVLDDVADSGTVEALLPGSNWNTLVTTRVEGLLPGAERIDLGRLKPAEARLLFCRVAFHADEPPPSDGEEVEALLAILGGVPQVLELAGTSVWKGTSVDKYRRAIGLDHGPAWADAARVQATLAQTLEDVGDDERSAFEVLGVLPACGADPRTVALVLGWPEGRATRALDRLARHRAARLYPEYGRFGLQPLLRQESRARVKARAGGWDELHAGVARSLLIQARAARALLRRNPALAAARWAFLRDLIETLDFSPWHDGAAGAVDIVQLFAFPAGDFCDRALGASERRSIHQAALELLHGMSADVAMSAGKAYGVLYTRLGDACTTLGDSRGAAEAYGAALALARTQMERNPNSAEVQRNLSMSLDSMGNMKLREGDRAGALEAYVEALELARGLVVQYPESVIAQRDFSVSLEKVGNVKLAEDDREGALQAYVEGLELARRLADQDRGSVQAQRDVSVLLEKVGNAKLAEGDTTGALKEYEEGLKIARGLAKQDPGNAQAQRDLSVSLNLVGDVKLKANDDVGARTAYDEGLELARKLAAQDPGNAQAQRDICASLHRIALLARQSGDIAHARQSLDEALAGARGLVQRAPDNRDFRSVLEMLLGAFVDVMSLPQRLVRSYLDHRLILFAGAGVAQAGGLPSWPALIRLVLDYARADHPAPETVVVADRAADFLARGELILALRELQRAMTSGAFGQVVSRALDDSRVPEVPPLARAIAALAPTLQGVVATNLDRFLERAFAGAWPVYTLPQLDLGERTHYILKLHGSYTDRNSWVFTRREYDGLMHRQPGLRRFMDSLYLTNTLLFVGYGLQDPDFDEQLGELRALAGDAPPQHFALMPRGQVDQYHRRHLFEPAGINILEYDPVDGHRELLDILAALAAAQPSAARGAGRRRAGG